MNSVEDLSRHPQLRRWPMAVNGQPVAFVAPPLQTPFDDGRFADVLALEEHSERIRQEFAA